MACAAVTLLKHYPQGHQDEHGCFKDYNRICVWRVKVLRRKKKKGMGVSDIYQYSNVFMYYKLNTPQSLQNKRLSKR